MTSAISRTANAAQAHGFAKPVKNEAPAAEGFEALFAAVANPAVTPANSPVAGEHGKPGEGAREDEKDASASASAFELAASMALVAVDGGRSEVRAVPKPPANHAAAESVVESSSGASPRAVPSASIDVVVRSAVRAPAFVSREQAPKHEWIEMPTAQVSRSAPDLEAEVLPAHSPPPKAVADAIAVKATPMPAVESEPVAARAMPARETPATPSRRPEPVEPAQSAARPRIELSPRALAQAAIVEAMRSPGRGRSPPTGEGDSPPPKNADPVVAASAQTANTPAVATSPVPVAPPVAAAMAVVADASPSPTKPIALSPAPTKPAASSRAAADILRQRQYALGSDWSPAGDIVPESAATFETLIALRKADGAFEGHALPAGEHESAAPVNAGAWLPNLPSSASPALTASAIVAPRVFDQTAWSAALAQQVTASAIAAAKETTVRIEPEGLGPIEVRVRVQAEHVDVRFAIEHPVTVNMVRAALPDLERMLAQSGLSLGDAQIAQQNAGQREHAASNRGAPSSSNAHDDEPTGVSSAVVARSRARVGLLDDFV